MVIRLVSTLRRKDSSVCLRRIVPQPPSCKRSNKNAVSEIQRRHNSRGATLVAGNLISCLSFPFNAGLRVPPYCCIQENFSQTLFVGYVAAGLPLCSGSLMDCAQVLLLITEFKWNYKHPVLIRQEKSLFKMLKTSHFYREL